MLEETDPHPSQPTKNMRIGWWNTHMTPPRGKALPVDEHPLVLEVIAQLLERCHIVCLGEVSSRDLDWLADCFSGTPFAVKDMTRGNTANKFNLGVIYNDEVATFIGNEFNIVNVSGSNYKISCRLDFFIHGDDYFSFLVSHWPSRLHKPGGAAIRSHYGAALRKEVDGLRGDGVKYIVVLGDYNDEPYNQSMTEYLRGCRDAAFVNSNPDLLYNPFWKQIVCPKGYIKAPGLNDRTGTYFYRSDNLHRWRVFDQMLFCSSFVGRSEWHLNEDATGVFRYERLLEAVEGSRTKLDHLPIVAELNKEATNG